MVTFPKPATIEQLKEMAKKLDVLRDDHRAMVDGYKNSTLAHTPLSMQDQVTAMRAMQAHTLPFPKQNLRSPFSITTSHGVIVICCETGRVSLPEGMPADVAASEFWKNLPSAFEQAMDDAVNKRAFEIFDRRWEEALETRWPKLLKEECDRAYSRGFDEAVRRLHK